MARDRFIDGWLAAALDYIPRWLEFQLRASAQPGCAVAIALDGRVTSGRCDPSPPEVPNGRPA